jgi:hypothetical protein
MTQEHTPQVSLGNPLTETQIAEVRKVRDDWMQIGLSTDRCDRAAAGAAVSAAYRSAGLPEPLVVWMGSPLGGVFATSVIKDLLAAKKEQLGGQLGGQLRGQLRGQLGDQLWGQLRGQLRGQLGGQLRGQLRDQLGKEISLWWDCYWLAYYTCALPLAGLDNSPLLDALSEACRLNGWWWPMRGVAVLTDRPTVLRRDDEGRLHSADGPALAYMDGYLMYAWHGIRVPGWVIQNPNVEQALAERNTEVRRAAFEAIGWDKVIDHLGAKPIDVCPDPSNFPHELQLYKLPDTANPYGQPVNLLLMTNGSPDRDGSLRRYGETVPPSIKSALDAAAWQFGLKPDVYQQLARRT